MRLCAVLLVAGPATAMAAPAVAPIVALPLPAIAAPAAVPQHVTDFRPARARPVRASTAGSAPTLVGPMETTSIERGQGTLLRLPYPAATDRKSVV